MCVWLREESLMELLCVGSGMQSVLTDSWTGPSGAQGPKATCAQILTFLTSATLTLQKRICREAIAARLLDSGAPTLKKKRFSRGTQWRFYGEKGNNRDIKQRITPAPSDGVQMGGMFFKDLRTHGDVLRQGVCASCIPHQERLFTARVCASLSALSQGSAEESLGEQRKTNRGPWNMSCEKRSLKVEMISTHKCHLVTFTFKYLLCVCVHV